jgi:hypothetical protein
VSDTLTRIENCYGRTIHDRLHSHDAPNTSVAQSIQVIGHTRYTVRVDAFQVGFDKNLR